MDNVANPAKEFYSVAEVIARLGVGRTLVYELIASGELRSTKLGARRLVPAEALDAFVAKLKAEAA